MMALNPTMGDQHNVSLILSPAQALSASPWR
jgi:hypothetical protein